jgi:hypothetical protein
MATAANGALAPAPSYVWWTLAAGAVFASAAMVIAPLLGLEISSEFGNGGGHTTWLTLFVGVFLVATFFWWLLVSRSLRFTLARGATVGILVGFFSYPVVIGLSELVYRDRHVLPLSERLDSVLLITGLTLMTTGFAATILMAGVGAIGTWLFARFHRPTVAIMRAYAAGKRRNPLLMIALSIGSKVIIVGLVGSYAWLATYPVDTGDLDAAVAHSAASYEDAIASFRTIEAVEAGMSLHPLCHSALMTHGRKVARVVIYFHGFTSCPAQGDQLAETLFAMGYNVYRPRLYGHGDAVPTPDAMSGLAASHLLDLSNQSVDLAHGLGDEVVVIGLSAGGTMAAWTAQFRTDVDQAIAVSPFFGPHVVPPWATQVATTLTLRLPNMVFAWNPLQDVPGEFPIALPSTHALAEIMLVGRQVQEASHTTPPAARIGLLLNDADVAVNNALTEEIVAAWRGQGADVAVDVLPFSHHLPHDIVNHRERGADVELVHARIIALMNR